MKKIMFLLICFMGLMLLFSLPAAAFDYTGSAWCCQDIVYCVNPAELSNICGANDRNFTQIVNSAASTWSAHGSAFQLIYGGPTSNTGCGPDASNNCTGILDGQNIVSVATGCSFPAGVLATSWWWYTINPGQNDNCCIFEADICFNDNESWYEHSSGADCSLNCYDLESVALHEFGHWASLGHEDDFPLISPKPSMYFSFGFCEMRRSLTPDDMAGLDYIYDPGGVINAGMRCDPVHSHPPYAGSNKVAMLGQCDFTSCDGGGCPPGQPFCDSVTTDPCLVICPSSDIVYTVTVKDSCGNPICDMNNTWLNFVCAAQPCPNEEPNWPQVFPDSCNPNTGEHYFTVDAGALDCSDCFAELFVNNLYCKDIEAHFLDVTGDLCVTWNDWIPAVGYCNDYDCNGLIDANDSLFFINHMGHCCNGCEFGPLLCDSVTTDPCLLVCPASDIVFEVRIVDSCGNPVCDYQGTWLDFSNCAVQPCPNEEPDWPRVFPDSCNPNTGIHYFTVDAGALDCIDCQADLYVNGVYCRSVQTYFLDINGDLCVTNADYPQPPWPCTDYDCNGILDAADEAIHNAHMDHCCGECPPGPPLCDSVITDTCLVICPASDIVYTVTLLDSCGNPVCDLMGTWLDFSGCDAIPCPNEEPAWPRVFPDSCNPNTGEHYFTVDAGYQDPANLCDCEAQLFVNNQFCRLIPARFLDITGDLCVTWDDWLGSSLGLICNDYNCDGIVDASDSLFFITHMDHCCGSDCQHGVPFCDSVTTDSCLLVCPASDIVYTVTVLDSCGVPLCDPQNTWLDFSNCAAIPCPNEEPNWPLVFPDSCNPNTGEHYFTVDAGALDCIDCLAGLYINGVFCRSILTYFLDIDGDLCVTDADYPQPPWPCTDYNCDGLLDAADQAIHDLHLGHCCTDCPPGDIFCDSLIVDSCLLVCPLGDELFTITTVDSCGNPVCNPNGLFLDFSNCPSFPCGNHHPNWPTVYPDSCNPNTGEHFFSIYASALDCIDCDVSIGSGAGMVCQTVPARFFDVDGDGCVLQQDFFGGQPCADYNCNLASENEDSLIFMSHLTHCCNGPCADTLCANGVISTAFQVAGTKDNFVGSESSSPGADLIPMLNCPLGMTNFFDSVITNQCFGHTFTDFWETKCCILDGELCLRITATGAIPNTDYISFAENGVQIWNMSLNDLMSLVSGGNDTLWSLLDTIETCLDLNDLPPDGNGITDVLASLVDGDFDVKIQDDTEVDYLELRVTRCCPGCCIPLIRGNVDYDAQDQIDIADLVYFVDYSFSSPPGPAPPCLTEADVDGNGSIDIADLVFMVDYMFSQPPGPTPVNCY